MTRKQAVAIIHFIKFCIRFFTFGSKITAHEYFETEQRFIDTLTEK